MSVPPSERDLTPPLGVPAARGPVVLFDGVCNLCQGSVQWMIARDKAERLRFASLQSEAGKKLLAQHGIDAPEGDPDSILFVEAGKVYDRSEAVLRMSRHLSLPWRLGGVFLVLPRFLRDPLYKYIARNRYRWFGKTEVCWMPTPALRQRFLT